MNREELEGVIGHEMSHIKNYDVRLVLIVATSVALIGLLASLLWRSLFFTRGGNNRDSGYLIIILIAAAALLSVVAVVVGPLMQFALSRSPQVPRRCQQRRPHTQPRRTAPCAAEAPAE